MLRTGVKNADIKKKPYKPKKKENQKAYDAPAGNNLTQMQRH